MKWRLVILCLCVIIFMPFKMYKTAKVRGWVPGAKRVTVTVADKWTTERIGRHGPRTTYWLSWAGGRHEMAGDGRVNCQESRWHETVIGDTVTVVYVGDDAPYLQGGIFASVGNVIFDWLLFLGAWTAAIVLYLRIRRETRAATQAHRRVERYHRASSH